MEAWTSTRPVREVEAAFLAVGLPSGRVRDPIEAVDDEQLRARGLLTELRHPSAPADRPSGYLGAALPISFAGRVDLPPAELLGASTDAVLRELAGLRRRRAGAAPRGRGDPVTAGQLDGMRVLDAGIWRPVPHATQLLADLGADVLKLEPPGHDPMRTFPDIFRDVASHKGSVCSTCAPMRAGPARSSSRRAPTCSARGGGPASPTVSASATST